MLFDSIVYGPIRSRRLGVSLGMNLMPTTAKLCTFDCVYCECGWNQPVSHPIIPTREQVREALASRLIALSPNSIDVITFSGNGEPTLHPEFLGIIEDTCALRDQYCPKAKISVLSNSTQLGRQDVVEALRLCDNRILKLDSAIDATMRLIDKPVNTNLTVEQIAQWLALFNGDFTLQTCFLRGEYCGQTIDNTTREELSAWYAMIERLHPQQVMIYVIDRATPLQTLSKVPAAEMEAIAAPLREKGIDVIVSA
ncbi:MAG: radical SAM protein [Paludibacteraceae bacterium]|nr:radical SAM protein [Paludibacteraceae bacterium]MBO5012546.1 radical SAM protein [Paludibacteraceae bacterium]